MKSLFIAGNWKSNKTITEAMEWLRNFQFPISNFQLKNTSIILCVPFTLLQIFKEQIKESGLPIALGAQDVSPFPEGAYTGEVSARQIQEFADWVIIGHSERRKYFGETDTLLKEKVLHAKEMGLKTIYCVPDETTIVPAGVDVVAYEPVWAIGTGKTDTPQHASHVTSVIKQKSSVATVIYGGSVTPDNVAAFIAQPFIDGVLAGGASLDPQTFFKLIVVASSPS
ncbi:triosephosphate isomerase [Candidatus Gottesmanbacteria bacterium]|nr:triosephosphate isomerase [Candidatus Gottesmanbacteria bacterium]